MALSDAREQWEMAFSHPSVAAERGQGGASRGRRSNYAELGARAQPRWSRRISDDQSVALPGAHEGPIRTDTPQRHRIHETVMWMLTLMTAVTMATINFVQIWCISFIVKIKFGAMQWAVDAHGVEVGVAVLVGLCALFATICSCLVQFFCPDAGGSGAPENKGWLNGNPMPDLFTKRTLVVRALATMLANTAGYPVGREGPTVTMGSNVAYLITHALGEEHVDKHTSVDIIVRNNEVTTTVIDQERFEHAKRLICIVGGACGMAMLFDSPIGGIIYMFEEITSVSWPVEVTFRAFAGTNACALASKMLLNLVHSDTKNFVIYEWEPRPRTWAWVDVPFFVLLALLIGPFSALHTRACLSVASCRQRAMKALAACQPWARLADAILFAVICAFTYAMVSLLGQCRELPSHNFDELVRYNCQDGMYNPVASLLLTTSEGAVRQLFSQKNGDSLHARDDLLCFAAYTVLNICLSGIPVPSGNFTGSMLIGGLLGRFWGACVRDYFGHSDHALSGIYAMVGSAAMLSGFKQMAVAVIVFISGCANDPSLIPPLMLGVTVSLLINRTINEKSFDEEQILRKDIPFLPPELPSLLEDQVGQIPILAHDLCGYPLGIELPQAAKLPPQASVRIVDEALACEVDDFPVIGEHGRCIGFATRARLEAALLSKMQDEQIQVSTPQRFCVGHSANHSLESATGFLNTNPSPASTRMSGSPGLNMGFSPGQPVGRLYSCDGTVQVEQLSERPPHCIAHDMPGSRLYSLFAKAGVRVASVVSSDGSFKGMVTRKGLIDTLRRPHQLRELLTHRSHTCSKDSSGSDGEGGDSDGAETVSLLRVARQGAGGI